MSLCMIYVVVVSAIEGSLICGVQDYIQNLQNIVCYVTGQWHNSYDVILIIIHVYL